MEAAKRIALIPAYEPGERLPGLLEQLKKAGFHAVVVDDGSGPDCAAVFEKVRKLAELLAHEENRGKGRALKTGFSYILGRFGEGCTVVTLDCDGQHTADDAARLCAEAERRPGTLFLGSRSLKQGTPLRSRFGNAVTRLVYLLATGHKIHDTQTGLRAFGGDLLPVLLSVPGERYEYEMNVLLECPRRKIPVKELEIATIYLDNNAGSHFDAVRDSWRIYREILRFSLSSFASFLVDYSLYSLLLLLTRNLTASNIGARLVSACLNYTLNRRLVFESHAGVVRSALQYALLAAAVLAGNTVLLNYLAGELGMNRWAAKLLTEISFFLLSWSVQRWMIFRNKAAKGEMG